LSLLLLFLFHVIQGWKVYIIKTSKNKVHIKKRKNKEKKKTEKKTKKKERKQREKASNRSSSISRTTDRGTELSMLIKSDDYSKGALLGDRII